MRKWLQKMCGLRVTRQAQTTAEYAIIVALVAVSSIGVILIFGDRIRDIFRTEEERLGGDETSTQQNIGDSQGAVGGGMLDE